MVFWTKVNSIRFKSAFHYGVEIEDDQRVGRLEKIKYVLRPAFNDSTGFLYCSTTIS